MGGRNLRREEKFIKRRRFHARWRRGMMVLASIVVFCTTYALILPAITLEKGCALEVHTHGEACYETRQVQTLACAAAPHSHTADCYNEAGEVCCGYGDFLVHVHDESCYGPDSQLLCPLPQVREHSHGEDCYALRTHTHGQTCYTRVKGAFVCQREEAPAHAHGEACTGTLDACVCPLEEGHTHGDGCRDEAGNLICGQQEGHTHGDGCYETTILECTLEETEGHTHNDECWEWTEVLICEAPQQERVLICQRQEVTAHTHGDGCYDGGTLVCGKREVLSHVHGEDCFQPGEILVLTCTRQEHTHDETCTPAADTLEIPAGDGAQPVVEGTTASTEEPTEGTGEPLTLEPTSAALSYKPKGAGDWIPITESTTKIPGDASFQLRVGFKANVDDLKGANYQMKYSPLPEWFRNVNDTDAIKDGSNNTVGTMTVDGQTVLLTFDSTWEALKKETQISGYFYVEAQADLAQIPGDGQTQITVGDIIIKLDFDDDLIAQYGEVTLDKAMGELEENVPDETGTCYDYISYILTVTVGPYGCPEVTVVDSFTEESQYVDAYIVEKWPEGTSGTMGNNVLTWNIGDMVPNTTKTLTYKVRLKPDYLGVRPKKALTNKATIYSGDYERTSSSQTFTPVGKATMSKIATEYIPNTDENGKEIPGGKIRYTVWVHADEGNNYTMENVNIWDSLDGAVDGSFKNDEKFLPYLSYDKNSFKYYIGGKKEQNGPGDLPPATMDTPPQFAANDKSFRFNVGNLGAGDSRLLIYDVIIDPGVFTQSNETITINNRAYIITDPNRKDDPGNRLESYKQQKNITLKKWARKLLGDKVETEQTIWMDETNTFTVPAGSYKYQVVVNEAGDWDVSSATMADSLQNDHMAYVGYVRVDAYEISARNNVTSSDQQAVDTLLGLTPAETKWVEINGKRSFTFTPQSIGMTEGSYAYLLTYYAQPVNTGEFTSVIVANQFDLTGTVGINGKYYTLGGIRVSASVTLEGNNYFSAQKWFWYYDAQINAQNQSHGTMYWVLKLDGNLIPGQTMLLDAIAEGPHVAGTVERAFFADSNAEFVGGEAPTAPQGELFTDYSFQKTDSGLEVTLTEDVKPGEGKSLYFVVSTYPQSVPEQIGTNQKYKNALSTKDPGENREWVSASEAETYLTGGEAIYKQMMEAFKVQAGDSADATQVECISGESNTILQKDYLMNSGNGYYVAWMVKINHGATLSGKYRVTDHIPKGMEVVYIQRYSTGGRSNTPVFAECPDLTGWKKVEQSFTFHDENPTPAIYYVKDQTVIWDVDGLRANPAAPDSCFADFLVVCKITDSELLLSGQAKTYTNTVSISNSAGKELGTGSADVTLTAPGLTKEGIDKEKNGSRYPFRIQLNELGTDLMPGEETIKLIDEMCDALILDPNTIKVINTKTQEPVKFTSAISGHTLTLTLPDDQPLTITYEATVNVPPGQTVTITNKAHWEGYDTTTDGAVSVPDFSYSVGAVVGGSTEPELTIAKVDQYDTGKKLSGATFTLTEMRWNGSGFVEKTDGLSLTGTTDQDGTIVFGKEDGKKLQCNIPYRLVETVAPGGYVLDETAHYVVFAKEENNVYPSILEDYKKAGAYVHYSRDFKYTYTAYNHKGEIAVEKKFQNADGSELEKIDGTYTFGLYEKGTLLQKTTLRWANGTSYPGDGKAHFTNVTLGKTYVVRELDDSGKPIDSGGTVSGMPFVVTYSVNEVTVDAQTHAASVTVTNRVNYPELPSTGGAGTELYTTGGLLTLAAGLLLYNQRKRRKGGRTPS